MRPKKYSSEGFVLARINILEADRIVILYTKDYGKLSYIAKGVRKPISRKRGSLEIFNQVSFSAARGKNFDIILEANLLNSYKKIRKDLKKVSVLYFFVETIGRITREEEQNMVLYNLLASYLDYLENIDELKKLRKKFIYDTLTVLGFWPIGKKMENPDMILNEVLEKEPNSVRVGRKILS